MRSTYAEQVLRRNEEEDEDEDEVKVKCMEMPSTPNDANVALERTFTINPFPVVGDCAKQPEARDRARPSTPAHRAFG